MAEWIKKNHEKCFLQKASFRSKDTYRLKVKGQKRYSMQMEMKIKIEVAIYVEHIYIYKIVKQNLKQRL